MTPLTTWYHSLSYKPIFWEENWKHSKEKRRDSQDDVSHKEKLQLDNYINEKAMFCIVCNNTADGVNTVQYRQLQSPSVDDNDGGG